MTRGESGWLLLLSAGLPPAVLRQLAWRTPACSLNRPRRPFLVGVLQPMSLPPSSAPTATGWSDSCRAGFAPAEEWRLSRRTRSLSLAGYLTECNDGGPKSERRLPHRTPRIRVIAEDDVRRTHRASAVKPVARLRVRRVRPQPPLLQESAPQPTLRCVLRRADSQPGCTASSRGSLPSPPIARSRLRLDSGRCASASRRTG